MTDPLAKTHLSPDGAIVNDEGGFVLPDDINVEDLWNEFIASHPYYEKAFPPRGGKNNGE